MRVLPKFTERSKKLFKGIENNRVEIFEADPHTFVAPVHCDAEYLLFVANGRGTVTLVSPEGRESFNVERGHIMRIPTGETVYMINRDNDEKLILVKLIRPVSTPGHFESFFPAGGENPETFFKAFRTETLEAIFKISRDRLEKVLGRQGDGFIKRASREQIRALSQQQEGGGRWPFGGGGSKREEAAPFNIYKKRPRHHNQFGKLIEAKVEECEQLRELDVSISFANISQGAMHVPYYNSKSTKISVVVGGKGNFEMACPHRAGHRGGERERGEHGSPVHYTRITGELRSGTVFVVPAGHPFVAMASKNDNLEVICFELNAENNQKVALAGKNNILRHFEREAKELSFSAPAEEVDTFLESNDEEFFFRGPRQPHEGRAAA
ncbi:hypothetical protein Nepgr_004245 [Nepenthes gracilis]|uniref:Cupin type-1 domain-containing protein n=1 Tax=Nepenthes gracilis TaxID=150966 RepID=A0AAD3S1A8_NEPGR|nr:hypothetical protein Nepgr_004245 [Nepenthes gracilis]